MKTVRMQVNAAVGLHARPAAVFVQQANQFDAEISVRNATTDSEWADAKSILGVLTLGVEQSHEIEVQASGQDEAEAVDSLASLIQSNFGEQA